MRMTRIKKERVGIRHTPTRGVRGSSMASSSTQSSNYTNLETTTEPRRSLSELSLDGLDIIKRNKSHNPNIIAEIVFNGAVKGVVEYLGSTRGTTEFTNPATFEPNDPNLVVLRASSRIEGDLASLTAFRHEEGTFFETDSALSSWVSIELPMPLQLSHYTLGYFIKGGEHIPRNWVSYKSMI